MKAELDSTPLGSTAACHKAGRIQNESFTHLFQHCVCLGSCLKETLYPLSGWSLFSFEAYRGDILFSGKQGAHSWPPSHITH